VKKEKCNLVKLFFTNTGDKNNTGNIDEAVEILAKFGSARLLRKIIDNNLTATDNNHQKLKEAIVKFDRVDYFDEEEENPEDRGEKYQNKRLSRFQKSSILFFNIGEYNARRILSYLTINFPDYVLHKYVLHGQLSSSSSSDVGTSTSTDDEVKKYFLENFDEQTFNFKDVFKIEFKSLSLFLFFLEKFCQLPSIESNFESMLHLITRHQTNPEIINWFLENDRNNITTFFLGRKELGERIKKQISLEFFIRYCQYSLINVGDGYGATNLDYLIVLLKFAELKQDLTTLSYTMFRDVEENIVGVKEKRESQQQRIVRLLIHNPLIFRKFESETVYQNARRKKINEALKFIKSMKLELAKYIPCTDIINLVLHNL
jgi:hypothetical protein